MSTATCPLCGETYLAAATVCADCRVALVPDPPEGPAGDAAPDDAQPDPALPWPDEDDEVGYDLDDWGPADRDELTAGLRAERIPHEWREGEIVVPERWADVTEELIDAIDHPDALEVDDDDGDDGGELLGSLYVATDVLSGDPAASGAVVDILELAPVVADRPPPYGLDGATWSTLQQRVATLAALLDDDADDEEVRAAATAARAVVRDLV